jgi:hypothetical protein
MDAHTKAEAKYGDEGLPERPRAAPGPKPLPEGTAMAFPTGF